MSETLNLDRIRWAHDMMKFTPVSDRLGLLKYMIMSNGGRWDLPSRKPGVYQPLIMSVQLFGVHAMAEELDELPKNWMQVAENILGATDNPAEVA